MALIVKVDCFVSVEGKGWPDDVNEKFGGDVSLAVAARVLRELPPGMTYIERTARIEGFSVSPDGERPESQKP